MALPDPPALRVTTGILVDRLATRPGAEEWTVTVDGHPGRAIAYPQLVGPLSSGDAVLLNTTAAALSLGTGGTHFIIAGPAAPEGGEFAGREAGHVMKLRYAPLQHRVCSVEEPASPHREAILNFRSLGGMPVVCADLISQMAAAAIGARAVHPTVRLAYVMTDHAALARGFSRLEHRLREAGILAATITVGQAFGGDLEAVNVHTGLIAAREVVGADVALVSQGPGNLGTESEYGFSGLGLVEALHAAEALGGRPILAPRFSSADPRGRHCGMSHHSRTVLRLARCRCEVPLPPLAAAEQGTLQAEMDHLAIDHQLEWLDDVPDLEVLAPFADVLTTMGRSVEQDPLFFRAALAAGTWSVSPQEASD